MLEELLKMLGSRGYEVMWRYEVMTNSIVIQLERRVDKQWCQLKRVVSFDDIRSFGMAQILKRMLAEMPEERSL